MEEGKEERGRRRHRRQRRRKQKRRGGEGGGKREEEAVIVFHQSACHPAVIYLCSLTFVTRVSPLSLLSTTGTASSFQPVGLCTCWFCPMLFPDACAAYPESSFMFNSVSPTSRCFPLLTKLTNLIPMALPHFMCNSVLFIYFIVPVLVPSVLLVPGKLGACWFCLPLYSW